MQLDPGRSVDDWLAYLRHEAEHTWGEARAPELQAALQRMAGALARVAGRTPRPEASPHQAALPHSNAGESSRG
jgi:hypothetical protein